jgi:hypothetical protein
MATVPARSLLSAILVIAALLCLASVAEAHGDRGKDSKIAKNKPIFDGLWKRKVSQQNKRWARRVSECESGRNPNALGAGGDYRGAFQFMLSTWKAAPHTPGGDPVAYSYRTQAFVAVRLKTRDGKGHWPACGG